MSRRDTPLTEGERWTRTELGRLRDGGWHPRAMRDFVSAAQSRADLTRGRRRALARQERRWVLAGAAAWQIASRSHGLPARAGGLAWWAACAVMLDWHLGMLETPEGHEVGLGAADALTLMRAWLVPVVAQRPDSRLLLIGGLTDLADGRVARATRCTRLGRDLEGLVDACFAAAALHGVAGAGGVSALPVALEHARLLTGAAYAATVYLAGGRAPDAAVRGSGRSSAPIRFAGLLAGGLGRRRLADRLLLAGFVIAIEELVRDPDARAAVGSLRSR